MTSSTSRPHLRAAREDALHRVLTPEETARQWSAPISQAERDEVLALVRWFTTRYPTPAERFAYLRRARARWLWPERS